ncbi:MAG TPA: cation acetate symporter [Stellaceae bacterium]|nr:cation acetate symporter [Stellaceae bacterium]
METLGLAIFLLILGITLAITHWAARRTSSASSFYTADSSLGPAQNGFALAGDWMSAAAFLGFSGLAALYGMDGSLYALGALVAFLTILMLVAEPLRNTGRYTFGDVIAFRTQRPEARLAAVVGTIVVNFAYLIPQMAGGAVLIKLLLGLPYQASVAVVGAGMIVYVMFGGMLATTWIQIVKAVLLLGTVALLMLLILFHFGFNPLTIFSAVEAKYGAKMLAPGNYLSHPLDQLSLGLSFALGTAGLPHVITRFYTVPDARTARKSVIWLMLLAGSVFFVTTLIGFASAVLVGQNAIRAADPGGNLALPLLAQFLGGGADSIGGQIFLAFVAAVAFATILAVAAGLTLSTSGAIAHDLYVNVIKRGNVGEERQVEVARLSSLAVGILAMLLGLLAQGLNVAVLVILAISIAASANFPIIVLSLFWRQFNTSGVIWGMAAGLASAITLALLGPAVQGPHALFPIVNPTIISMPIGFIGALLGTFLVPRKPRDVAHFDEVLFRAQTGFRTD